MRKKKFSFLFVLGALMIVVSFSLIVSSQICKYIGNEKCQKIVEQMENLLPEESGGVTDIYSSPNMPVLEIDDTDYVALFEIPSLNVKLPIANEWDESKLKISPASFYGSCYDNSMVIGGAGSSKQFSFCKKIENDTVITITDMTGTQFTYKVSLVERSKTAENEWLINDSYDLTLFCQNTYGMEYIAVRCMSAN